MSIIPRPQVQVVQAFIPSLVTNLAAQSAYVFGPHYQLMYMDDPDVKDHLRVGAYDPSIANEFDYPQLDLAGTVDPDSVRVFLSDVLARYISLPEDQEAPLVVVSDHKRNAVRSAPYVDEAREAKFGPGTQDVAANGVFLQAGGCVGLAPDLPTNYYLWPAQLAIVNAFDGDPAQDAVLNYKTSAGVTGDVSILATDNPLAPGSTVAGPHGIVLDLDAIDQVNNAFPRVASRITYVAGTNFDSGELSINGGAGISFVVGANHRETVNTLAAAVAAANPTLEVIHAHGPNADEGVLWIIGASNTLSAVTESGSAVAPSVSAVLAFNAFIPPRTITFSGASGAAFTLTVKASAVSTLMNLSLTNGQLPLSAEIEDGSALNVSWDAAASLLEVEFDGGTTTLEALRAALVGQSGLDDVFDVSMISGTETDPVTSAADQFGTPLYHGSEFAVLRDLYRIRVEDSAYVFADGNGFTASPQFKGRGVKVGDVVTYSYVDPNTGDPVDGMSTVAGLRADRQASRFYQPVGNSTNQETLPPELITPNTGLDRVEHGSDNQRRFDGQGTKVYALGSQLDDFEYAGDLPSGTLEETFTFRVTSGGVPGVARGTVSGTSGYYRADARVLQSPDGDPEKAVLYLGRNLWVTFQIGTTDGDFRFQVGDWFTVTPPVGRRWTQVDAETVVASGEYEGPEDTTYVIEVIRGGYFTPQVTARAGVQTPDQTVLAYTANPGTADEFVVATSTITGSSFLDTTPTGTYGNLRNLINALGENVRAELVPSTSDPANEGELIIRGPADLVQTVALGAGYTGASISSIDAVEIAADITGWSGGDVDDEYILRCAVGGDLESSRFHLLSLRDDQQFNIRFDDGVARAVGDSGLQLTLTAVANPTFRTGDEWVVIVNATRPQVAIRDSAGIDASVTRTISGAQVFALGVYGLSANFETNANGGLVKGDQYYVEAKAESDGAYRTLLLEDTVSPGFVPCVIGTEGQIEPTLLALDLHMRIEQTEVTAPRVWNAPAFDWTADADGLTLNSGIRLQAADWVNTDGTQDWLAVVSGDAYVEYRALLQQYPNIHSIDNIDDVATVLGRVHPDNPLAQNVYFALRNSTNRQVYFTAIPSDDLEGYRVALAIAEHSTDVYALAPTTTDREILDMVKDHILRMSDESVKQWRIGCFGSSTVREIDLYSRQTNPDGVAWTATVDDDPGTPGTVYTELTASGTRFLEDVKVGDTVRLRYSTDPWGEVTWETNRVASIQSNEVLILETPLAGSVEVPERFEIWRTRSVTELVQAYEDELRSYGNRRIYCAVPSALYSGNTRYGADAAGAAIAGAISAVPPQKPITRMEIFGFDAVPDVLETFTQVQLDRIATAGGLILTQDASGDGHVFVRHQVSTAASDGDVYTRELSVTKNVDACTYLFAHQLEPYYGRYNITEQLLTVIETQLNKMIDWLVSESSGAGLLGPMLLAENTRLVRVQQHPTLKDHVIAEIDLDLPLPANVIRLTAVIGDLAAFRAQDTGTDELIAGILNT